MADVFLSYASVDRERVQPLVELFESEGLSVWWDRKIGLGASFDREIERELDTAACVVVLWTAGSIDSDWVRSESSDAMERGILVPVLFGAVKPPLAFRRLQSANLLEWPEQRGEADALLRHVKEVVADVKSRNEELATATQEASDMVQRGDQFKAFRLAKQALPDAPPHHPLRRLFAEITLSVSFVSEPSGAEISMRPYGADESDWLLLGTSPLTDVPVPLGPLELRLRKQDYETVHCARLIERPPIDVGRLTEYPQVSMTLDRVGDLPGGMVRVSGGESPLFLTGYWRTFQLDSYFIDKYEVKNEDYQEFVDSHAYTDPDVWSGIDFWHEGAQISWQSAMDLFKDKTGYNGPADWELGRFPAGRGSHPVGGISWYEAVAYARFREKNVPTVYHWARAALSELNPYIIPRSNLEGESPASVGSFGGLGPFGTYDTAGNLREWCWNSDSHRRWILGGSWSDPRYVSISPATVSPMDRSLANGFRLAKYVEEPRQSLFNSFKVSRVDYKREPVSDRFYRSYAERLSYQPQKILSTHITQRKLDDRGWIVENIDVTGESNQHLLILRFFRKDIDPPAENVIYFPGNAPFTTAMGTSTDFQLDHTSDWIVNSGRALIFPVWNGAFERRDGFLDIPEPMYSKGMKERFVDWRRELGLTVDVLLSLQLAFAGKIGYLGTSLGGGHTLLLLAVEHRISAAIAMSAGIGFRSMPPEVDQVNFLPRITTPTLMINGEHDFICPKKESQDRMFELLGTPASDKRHVVFEAGHADFPRGAMIQEGIAWLDRYLGG